MDLLSSALREQHWALIPTEPVRCPATSFESLDNVSALAHSFHVHLVSKVLSGLFIQDVRIFFLSRNCGEQVFLPLRSYRTFKMIPKAEEAFLFKA